MIGLGWLLRPGRGRRRLTIPGLLAEVAELRAANLDLAEQLAARARLAQVYCYDRDAAHPVWYTSVDAPTPRCPWCALRAKDAELALYRPPMPSGPPLVPAPKDQPHWGEDSTTTARTRQDTLAGMAESDADRELLTMLSRSIPAPTVSEAADVTADTQPVDASGLRADQARMRAPLPGERPHRPDGSQATTDAIPLPRMPVQVRLRRDPAPRIRQPEVCAPAAEHAVASVREQLAATPPLTHVH